MTDRISAFIEAHPGGWNHGDWLGFLGELERDGVAVGDAEALGLELEEQRLSWTLRQASVRGLGPKRIEAIAERFHTLWNLRQATTEEIAEIKTVPKDLAERVAEAISHAG